MILEDFDYENDEKFYYDFVFKYDEYDKQFIILYNRFQNDECFYSKEEAKEFLINLIRRI